MKPSIISRFLISAAVCSILPACSGRHRASEADLEEASRLGAVRAQELTPAVTQSDTFLVEQTLIDVREREQRLRREGYNDMADSYIGGFIEALDSVNPSLAAELH